MRSLGVVLTSPILDLLPGLIDRPEGVAVQALMPERAVARLNEGVLRRLPRLDEVQMHAMIAGPLPKGLADELGAVVDRDGRR